MFLIFFITFTPLIDSNNASMVLHEFKQIANYI